MSTTKLDARFNAPQGGGTIQVQLSPFGEFPQWREGAGGKPELVVQKCDRQAFDALLAAFSGDVLVDFDHAAEDGGRTAAAAWVKALRVLDTGLFADFAFTPEGAAAVNGRGYRFVSPCWEVDADGRPSRLVSVGLTNKPNLPVAPVINSARGAATPPAQNQGHDMKELALLFGLPEAASEADILAAAKASREASDALQKRVAELEAAALDGEAEQAALQNKAKIADKAAFKKLFVQNKAHALAMLACVAEPKPVCNAADAKPPSFAPSAADGDVAAAYRAMPPGAEKDAFLVKNKAALLHAMK